MTNNRKFGFSPGTLDRALHDLAVGKPLDAYEIPERVKQSIASTHYSERDINDAFAGVATSDRAYAY